MINTASVFNDVLNVQNISMLILSFVFIEKYLLVVREI